MEPKLKAVRRYQAKMKIERMLNDIDKKLRNYLDNKLFSDEEKYDCLEMVIEVFDGMIGELHREYWGEVT